MTYPRTGPIPVTIDPDLAEIIPDFFAFRRKDLEDLAEHLSHGDFREIQRIGHNLKGCGGGYGFDAITDIGGRLERAAKDVSVQEIEACGAELADYLARVQVVMG